MNDTLQIIRPNLMICQIMRASLDYIRGLMPAARVITYEQYRAIEAGTLVADLTMGYSILLDEAPTPVVVAGVSYTSYTKTQLFDVLVILNLGTEVKSTDSKDTVVQALMLLDQAQVQTELDLNQQV